MSELANKSHENVARAALDAWVHALYPGLSGDKRAGIVARSMQLARDEVLPFCQVFRALTLVQNSGADARGQIAQPLEGGKRHILV